MHEQKINSVMMIFYLQLTVYTDGSSADFRDSNETFN